MHALSISLGRPDTVVGRPIGRSSERVSDHIASLVEMNKINLGASAVINASPLSNSVHRWQY